MCSSTRHTATALAIATTMLSFKGIAQAATAAVPATPTDTMRKPEVAMDASTPTSAKIPANPRPQAVGTALDKAMPIS